MARDGHIPKRVGRTLDIRIFKAENAHPSSQIPHEFVLLSNAAMVQGFNPSNICHFDLKNEFDTTLQE